MEMKRFSEEFFDGVKPETFTETSAGIADLITTCFGGRNRKCAEAFVKTGKVSHLSREVVRGVRVCACFQRLSDQFVSYLLLARSLANAPTPFFFLRFLLQPFDVLEKELLNGQKLQGTETAREIHHFLKARGKVDDYPLFRAVYSIAYEGEKVGDLTAKL